MSTQSKAAGYAAAASLPGSVEECDSNKLLSLMTMVREGQLSAEFEALFKAHARVEGSEGSEALVQTEDLPAFAAALRSLGVRTAPKAALRRKDFEEFLWNYAVSQTSSKPAPARAGEDQPRSMSDFQILTTLGEGATGRVLLVKGKKTEEKHALKVIHKAPQGRPLGAEELRLLQSSVRQEVEHLSLLDHPHIIRLHCHFEDAQGWYLALQYCASGDLCSLMDEYKEEDGRDTACSRTGLIQMPHMFTLKVTYQVLLALAHIHSRGIMHLDVKGQNVMFQVAYKGTILPREAASHPPPFLVMKDPHAVLVDFGTSQKTSDPCEGPVGTPAFMAPEVWSATLTPQADIFSLGNVFFQMLAGKMAFGVPDIPDVAECYWQMEPTAPWNEVPYVAPQCCEVCDQMLAHDITVRPSAEDLLAHPLFADLRAESSAVGRAADGVTEIPVHLAERLASYADRDVLQKCMRMKLAMEWAPNQTPSFRRLFAALGGHGAGVKAERLGGPLAKALGAERARRAVENLVAMGQKTLDWTEFVAALADIGDPKAENFLRKAFDAADSDGDGLLNLKDVASLMHADEKKHAVLLQEYMVALCGRDSPGARVDWSAFRKHFRTSKAEREPPSEAGAKPETKLDQGAGQGEAGPSLQRRAETLLEQAMRSIGQP